MSLARSVPATAFLEVLHDFEHTAFRLQLRRSYAEPEEDDAYAAFLRGDALDPAASVPELREWYAAIRRHVAAGKTVQRVRVQEDPPTDYQRFERYLDRWNLAAGEDMRYLTRHQAQRIGLLPDAGSDDWWLLDSSRVLLMQFDGDGRRVENILTTDPAVVVQACAWRDLAVHHSTQAASPGVAA